MSLVGNLEDLGLGDILQIVSLSRKSGVLSLAWGEVRGRIIFRDGQVVGAFSSGEGRSLPAILVDHKALPADKLEAAERAVNAQPDARHAKEALARDYKQKPETVEEAIREQTETIVFHFFTWPEGTFNFELQEIDAELAALTPPEHSFVLDIGLSPQFLAMEGTRLQDERRRERVEAPVGPPLRAGKPEPEKSKPEPEPPAKVKPEPTIDMEADFGSVADALAFYEKKSSEPGHEPEPEAEPVAEPEPEPAIAKPPRPPAPATAATPRAVKPAKPAVPEPETNPAPAPSAKPERPHLEGQAPLLVAVDDDRLMLESLVHHLAARGYRIETFDNVTEALGRIQVMVDTGDRPAAVIVDLLMPDSTGRSTLGGLEMLEKLRHIHSGISVYMMSDYENEPGRRKAEELGARFFFMKPKSSQLDEDFGSPELVNFAQVLWNALQSEPKTEPRAKLDEGDLINLGEELRREFGEEVVPAGDNGDMVKSSRGLAMLKTMISELNDPASSGQITLLILRFAAELMNRAVIFLVAKTQLAGLGQFGLAIDGVNPQKHVRQIRIPLNAPSIFREAIQKRMPLKKPLKPTQWNDYLVQNLGGLAPREVFVAPIIAGGKIAAILYGDNAPDEREIGDTESLEIFLAQAGLAMEKALLERRLREMGSSPDNG